VAEALRTFKRIHLLKKNPPDIDGYAICCLDLLSIITDERINIDDQSCFNRNTYDEAEKLIRLYKLDLSDMLQILSIKASFTNKIGMITILITDDNGLFFAAKREHITTIWLQDKHFGSKVGLTI
jgi:hypothetical protein